LGVNIYPGPSTHRPYPTLYFPGLPDRHNAALIRIYGTEHLDGFEFLLPDRIPTREVSVKVLWWDDTPVTMLRSFAASELTMSMVAKLWPSSPKKTEQ
jgi:hypothetical protein